MATACSCGPSLRSCAVFTMLAAYFCGVGPGRRLLHLYRLVDERVQDLGLAGRGLSVFLGICLERGSCEEVLAELRHGIGAGAKVRRNRPRVLCGRGKRKGKRIECRRAGAGAWEGSPTPYISPRKLLLSIGFFQASRAALGSPEAELCLRRP